MPNERLPVYEIFQFIVAAGLPTMKEFVHMLR